MSKLTFAEASCPKCERAWKQAIHASVNVTMDPSLKERLVRGDRQACAAHGARYIALSLPLRAELLATDGFHPSAEGYARWAETIVATAF